MSDSNPFAKLQSLFDKKNPSRDSNTAKGSSPSSSETHGKRPAHAPLSKCQGQHRHNDDSALFLHTVNSLPKAPKAGKGPQEDSMFKQAMQAAGIVPMDKKNRKKRSKAAPHAPQTPDQTAGSSSDSAPGQASGLASGLAPGSTSQQRTGVDSSQNATVISQSFDSSPQNPRLPQNPGHDNPIEDNADAREAELFASAMNNVRPVNKRGRDIHSPADAKTPPRPLGKTPAEIMQEIIDGRIEFAIQHTGEYMEGFVQGVSPEVLDKLRLGQFSPEAHVDLHGLNALQAYTELTRFIQNCYQRNIRTVTVITGRGKNSPEGVAVLRNLIQEWLTRDPFKRVVLAFCSAQPRDGGAGALYVLLRKYKKSIGKIQWELPYSGPDADF